MENAATSVGGQVSAAFITTGYTDWKKALEKTPGKERGFVQHNEMLVTGESLIAIKKFRLIAMTYSRPKSSHFVRFV